MTALKDLIRRNRSYRRFKESHHIARQDLLDMIDAARYSASARNAQPLKYFLSNTREMNDSIFPCLAWAGYLKDWQGPAEGERPSAYIIQLHDVSVAADYYCDDGIAAQSILLTAVDKGLGGCIIASVKRDSLAEIIQLPEQLNIIQVIALGKPAEQVILEPLKEGDTRYWRDSSGVHHVPKRSMEDLIIN